MVEWLDAWMVGGLDGWIVGWLEAWIELGGRMAGW